MKVLLLEDDPQSIENLKNMILQVCPTADITVMTEIGLNFYETKVEFVVYDAVITDVNMPGYTDRGGMMMGPIGIIIALKALQAGVKRIGVFTDSNHHEANPISKGSDLFDNYINKSFIIGDTRFIYENRPKEKCEYIKLQIEWLFHSGNESFDSWFRNTDYYKGMWTKKSGMIQ